MFEEKFKNIQLDNQYVVGINKNLLPYFVEYLNNTYNRDILVLCNTTYESNDVYSKLMNNERSLLFLMDDFLNSEAIAISPEYKISRLETLKKLSLTKQNLLVTNLMGYLRFLPDKEVFNKSIISIKKNMVINKSKFLEQLISIGYEKNTFVSKTGDVAVRGFVIDIFPLDSEHPIRIEFFDDEIENIKVFDCETQKTVNEILEFDIYPSSEFLNLNNIEEEKHYNLEKACNKISNILSYLNNPIIIYFNEEQIESGYKKLMLDIFEYSKNLETKVKYMYELEELINNDIIHICEFDDNSLFTGNYININSKIFDYMLNPNILTEKDKTIVVYYETKEEAQELLDLYSDINFSYTTIENIFSKKINLIKSSSSSGFIINDIYFLSYKELKNKKVKRKFNSKFKHYKKVDNLNNIKIGDYVVHEIHGIGRYEGIKVLKQNGLNKDYVSVNYKNNDKLYIPVEKLNYLYKYSSNEGMIPILNKLDGKDFKKTKSRIKEKVELLAKELLEIQAKRELNKGIKFLDDDEYQIKFESNIDFTLTKDQEKVITEIKNDMQSSKVMDRLLCGDVGYGKTEVAFVAIFKAILSGYQVGYLCPTTILSDQHFKNAIKRFSNFPVKIALLNRFVSAKKVKQTLEDIESGNVDLVIGTHRLLSNDIKFKKLGLLVIDEEQRFGVKHKEKIKKYKNNLDILSLSATPIPRTLQMSMTGLRGLSTIETPPVNRFPIQTYVLKYNKQILKEAIYKELSRDGQIFILYNNVSNMHKKLEEIAKLVPEANIVCAHGQMNKNELENIMRGFINKEYQILICTTIIETGIDIPSVNTLIVFDADKFGLSQLYQIRGRVGRSNVLAYSYMFYNEAKVLTEVSIKRLQAIKEFTELGSGFAIARRDLAIRGAGDILGQEQSGFIDSVGIELYLKILENEMKVLKGEVISVEDNFNKPLFQVETHIPDTYVEDVELKIFIHKRINEITSEDELLYVKNEISDRFGKMPEMLELYMIEQLSENMIKDLNYITVTDTIVETKLILSESFSSNVNGESLFLNLYDISKKINLSFVNKTIIISIKKNDLHKHYIYIVLEIVKYLKTINFQN